MQKKYAGKDFAAVSVNLDDPKDAKARQKALDFLQKQQATFTNVMLDAKPEVWQEKLKIDGPPCIYVFDRDGRFVKKLPVISTKDDEAEEAAYSVVAPLVAKLLGQ
jgi:hypothetical protein